MTEEENKAIELIGCLNLNESYIITSKQWNEQDVHKAIDIILNLIEKLKKENQELRNTKNNCPQFNTSGIKCKNKDIHCPTSKETLDYYENFLIPGYEEEIKKLKKENEELKNKVVKRDNEIIQLEESAEKEFLTKQEVKENYIPKSKIIVNKYKYENKCHVLRNEDSNYKWYEMGKNFGAVYALEELLEEKQEQ